MIRKSSQQEHGQILVILVLALVALLAFTALAVDVGMVFSDRRYDQNVADSAALAGTQMASKALVKTNTRWADFNCNLPAGKWVTSLDAAEWYPATPPSWLALPNLDTGKTWFNSILDAAIARAKINKVTIEHGFDNQNGVAFHCEEIDYGSRVDKFIDVKAMVSSTTNTSFAHFIFGGTLRNTVEAVARDWPVSPSGAGNSIIALKDSCPPGSGGTGGMDFNGTVQVVSIGGRIFSNWCMTNQPNATIIKVLDSGGNCISGAIGYIDSSSNPDPKGNACPHPTLYPTTSKFDYPPVENPACSATITPSPNFKKGVPGEIHPGTYEDINFTEAGLDLYVYPGLYCIKAKTQSQGFTFTGGNIISVDSARNPVAASGCVKGTYTGGCGSTFWMINGTMNIAGNGHSNLVAPSNNPSSAVDGAIEGLLFGAPMFNIDGTPNTTLVKIAGTTGDNFTGTIYIPHGEVDIKGTAVIPLEGPTVTQILADRIAFSGNASVTVKYDENQVILKSAGLELQK